MNRTRQSGYRVWNNFADGIQQDEAAIRAALSLSWLMAGRKVMSTG